MINSFPSISRKNSSFTEDLNFRQYCEYDYYIKILLDNNHESIVNFIDPEKAGVLKKLNRLLGSEAINIESQKFNWEYIITIQ